MNTKQKGSTPPPATITMRDVYYVLFRHKWMISILAGLGVACSLALYFLWPYPYTSEAEIFVRYIQETTGPSEMDAATRVKMPEEHGAGVLNTEIQILTSRDLAIQVANNLGVTNILRNSKDTNDFLGAASFISSNLKATVQKDSDVIFVQFSAEDPTVVRPILTELIKDYKSNYFEIHLAPGVSSEFLEKKRDTSKGELETAMRDLTDTKIKTGITSLEDAKKDVADMTARIKQNISETRAELAETRAAIKVLQEKISGAVTNKSGTNRTADLALASPRPSREVLSKYQELISVFNSRRAKEQDLLVSFTESSPLVQAAQHQREVAEANMKALEDENPGLLALKPGELGKSGSPAAPAVDYEAVLQEYLNKQIVLTAKYQELTNQATLARDQVADVDNAENKIMEETSERDAADAKYKRSVLNADQVSIEAAMGSQVSNILPIESPTPPSRNFKQILKMTLGTMGFFFALAFGLPFFIEMVLDQSLKNAADVKARIGMPFFITIPRTNGVSKLGKLKQAQKVPLLTAQSSETPGTGVENGMVVSNGANGKMALWDSKHELRPFFETLRDRLMTYFEMINLTHKPKLVAVTSCGAGAGVTTTATGLASSLSEIGEGNVLLVNMNVRDGEAHHFYKGKLACGIEEVLEKKNREQAQVQNNLFVAHESDSDDRLPRVLPKRFSHLVPMMKASDYDYIIFDMPPVSEISITPRLARFMDMVLLVVESEKTSRDAAASVASLLAESKTNVGLVLNKNRSYMPKRFEQVL
jgi:polysaccharide biosynthesis transport protein